MLIAACEDGSPAGPTSSSALDQFVQALREQGLNVSAGDEIPPEANRFFSVPARQIRTNDTHLNVFVYPSAVAAAAEAASISPDGQPSPTVRVTWVSTPRFYRQGSFDRPVRWVLWRGDSSAPSHAGRSFGGGSYTVRHALMLTSTLLVIGTTD